MDVGGSRSPASPASGASGTSGASSAATVVNRPSRPRRITASWVGVPDPATSRSTLEEVPESEPGPPPTPRPPGRALLLAAGALTQLTCGACLLIGTIAIVLVQQTKIGGVAPVALWLITAMAGLVFGGLIYRGGLFSMLVATVIDVGFGLIL